MKGGKGGREKEVGGRGREVKRERKGGKGGREEKKNHVM